MFQWPNNWRSKTHRLSKKQCGTPLWLAGRNPANTLLIELNAEGVIEDRDGVTRGGTTTTDCKRVDSFDEDAVAREDDPLEVNVRVAVRHKSVQVGQYICAEDTGLACATVHAKTCHVAVIHNNPVPSVPIDNDRL